MAYTVIYNLAINEVGTGLPNVNKSNFSDSRGPGDVRLSFKYKNDRIYIYLYFPFNSYIRLFTRFDIVIFIGS